MANEAPLVEPPASAELGDGTPSWIAKPGEGVSAPPDPKAPPALPAGSSAGGQGAQSDADVGWQKRLDSEVARRKALEDRIAAVEKGGSGGTPKADEPFKFDAYDGWKAKALSGPEGAAAAALFDGFHQAVMADLDRAVVGYVDQALAPLAQWRQTSEVENFYKSNPTASGRREEIEALAGKYGLPREEAWKIVNYGAPAGPSRTTKLPPPGSSPRAPGAPSAQNGFKTKSLNEAIERAMADKGM